MDPEVLRQLQTADWATLGKQMLGFAVWWSQYYEWRSGTNQHLPKGNTLADIVQQVIGKTLDGRRQWDPAKGPLKPWLMNQVKSELDALAKSATHLHELSFLEEESEEETYSPTPHEYIEDVTLDDTYRYNPERVLIEKEEQERVKRRADALIQAASEDPELEEVFQAVADGCKPQARYLAKQLGTSPQDIYNRMKRLRRRASAIKESP
ncbi:MAG: hypothetical protein M5U01_19595 [Ardenticatenaceae bacterium]|nr:hypothetical protein [Ardenticatenaceae bacterium]